MNKKRGTSILVKAPPASSKPTATFRKKVLSIVGKREETKYASERVGLADVADVLNVPGDLIPCIPPLKQGYQSNQRVGQKVNSCHGRVDLTFFFNPSPDAPATKVNDNLIKIFFLKSKQAKSYGQVSLLPGNTLLDLGDQTTADWGATYSNLQYDQMPLSKEDWTGRTKHLHIRKNQGQIPGGDQAGLLPLTYGQVFAKCSFTWKHNTLMYDDTGSDNPTNFAPVIAYVVYDVNNNPTNSGQVQVYMTKHIWFKDS